MSAKPALNVQLARGNASPATSRVAPRENPQRNPLLTSDTVPFETEKVTGTRKFMEGLSALVGKHCGTLRLMAAFGFGVGFWLFVPTTCPLTRIGPGKPVFRRASGSPDRASLDPHFEDVGSRPVYGTSAFDPSKVNWKEIVLVTAGEPYTGEVRTTSKRSRRRCIWRPPF